MKAVVCLRISVSALFNQDLSLRKKSSVPNPCLARFSNTTCDSGFVFTAARFRYNWFPCVARYSNIESPRKTTRLAWSYNKAPGQTGSTCIGTPAAPALPVCTRAMQSPAPEGSVSTAQHRSARRGKLLVRRAAGVDLFGRVAAGWLLGPSSPIASLFVSRESRQRSFGLDFVACGLCEALREQETYHTVSRTIPQLWCRRFPFQAHYQYLAPAGSHGEICRSGTNEVEVLLRHRRPSCRVEAITGCALCSES